MSGVLSIHLLSLCGFKWTAGFNKVSQLFLLHEGTEDPSRRLLLAAGIWKEELHNEIWVFNQGFWQKSSSLWNEVQKADWGDVILKDAFKRDLQKDVNGFFSSEAIYKELAIPWKVRPQLICCVVVSYLNLLSARFDFVRSTR